MPKVPKRIPWWMKYIPIKKPLIWLNPLDVLNDPVKIYDVLYLKKYFPICGFLTSTYELKIFKNFLDFMGIRLEKLFDSVEIMKGEKYEKFYNFDEEIRSGLSASFLLGLNIWEKVPMKYISAIFKEKTSEIIKEMERLGLGKKNGVYLVFKEIPDFPVYEHHIQNILYSIKGEKYINPLRIAYGLLTLCEEGINICGYMDYILNLCEDSKSEGKGVMLSILGITNAALCLNSKILIELKEPQEYVKLKVSLWKKVWMGEFLGAFIKTDEPEITFLENYIAHLKSRERVYEYLRVCFDVGVQLLKDGGLKAKLFYPLIFEVSVKLSVITDTVVWNFSEDNMGRIIKGYLNWKVGEGDGDKLLETINAVFKEDLNPAMESILEIILLDLGKTTNITQSIYPSWAPLLYANLYIYSKDDIERRMLLNAFITSIIDYPSGIFFLGNKIAYLIGDLKKYAKNFLEDVRTYIITNGLHELIEKWNFN
ncbi:MAG: hypothetical protein ABIL16_01035 [candidate division WOR-3 bacterium]